MFEISDFACSVHDFIVMLHVAEVGFLICRFSDDNRVFFFCLGGGLLGWGGNGCNYIVLFIIIESLVELPTILMCKCSSQYLGVVYYTWHK